MTEEKVVEQTTTEAPGEAKSTDNELEMLKAQAAEYLDQWRRTTAEFANYRRRKDKEVLDYQVFASADIVKRLLPVLDDIDRAFKMAPAEFQPHPWMEGFRLIERKFNQILEQAGVTTIETVGQPFDPTFHESVADEESNQPEGTILEEYRKGYKLGDKVLRPATVKIAK